MPYIIRRDTMTGPAVAKFEEDLFKLTSEMGSVDGFLIPTAEVPSVFRDEILNEKIFRFTFVHLPPVSVQKRERMVRTRTA